ncbi:uncharacterized protein LOC134272409 [Saccostrea cucullata]|uniref:uncharacterized protein LOC134272409 n=1 Tax=Saccostrea cuccullata TaxID=36930 RepID=UPI002ED6396B
MTKSTLLDVTVYQGVLIPSWYVKQPPMFLEIHVYDFNEGKILDVKEVDVCPINRSSWEKASRDLNCTTQGRYQCTSNENQTALLEYCYDEPPTFVLKGYCWILLDSNYVHTYNCSGFIDGCPNETYRSDELYKYQECLQLNKLEGCYTADEECSRQNKVTPLPSTTSQSSDPNSSSEDVVIGIIISIIIVLIIIAVATLVARKFRVSKCSERDHGDEEICLLDTAPTLKIEIAGENVVLRCILPKDKRRLPSNIIWSKDKNEIKIEDTGGKYRFADQKLDLVIESASHLDIGEYVCCLKYDNHCKKFVKCSLDCPSISLGGISSEGPDVVIQYSISVSKDCIPLTTLSWRKNGCSLKPSDEPDTYVGGTLEDTFLKICNVVGGNSDKYECTVTNIFGEASIIFILDCPTISLGGISTEGPDVVIEYTVSVSKDCIPLTTLSWRKNGCSLKPSDEPDTYVGGTLEDTFLKICNVVGGNSDKYECTVTNIFGEATISFILDDIQCSSKECQGILLCCLLLDEFRFLKFEPDQWKEKLNQSKEFCSVVKKETTENALDAIEYETLHEYIEFKDEEYCLISPDRIFQSFLQRSGFLDFFVKYSTPPNLGIFCRSPGYRKDEGEICCNLSPEQFKNLVQQLKFDILSNNSITDETCHQIIEDELNIPKGILSLGKEGIQNYLRDLRSGEHKVFVARCMLVGCEGAGKTSLLQRLQGKDNPDPPSTRGLDTHVNIFTVNEDRLDVTANQNKPSLLSNLNTEEDPNTNQAEQDHGDQPLTKTRFGGSFVEKRVENSASFNETPLNIQENNEQVSEVSEYSKTRLNEVFNENAIPDGPVLGNKGSTTTEPSKENDEDVETIEFGPLSTDDANISPDTDITFQILSECFTDKDKKIITFFDFAGQFAYYACHHIYFSPNDFYILVMDIKKKI